MMIATLGGGWAERVTTILASELSKKYPVYLLYMFQDGKQSYQIAPGVHLIDGSWSKETFLDKYFHIPFRWPFRVWSILCAKQKYHIDVTVSMLHKPNRYNSLLRWKDKRIMSERKDPSRKTVKEFEDAKSSYSKADHVVFQSVRVQGLFSEEIQAKSTIIRNPIGVTCYADKKSKKRIVTVGRYTPQKNHELLIQAFQIFYQTHPSYTLHLYGEGELKEKLLNLIEQLQLQNCVYLEGFKSDIHKHIKDAKMFVLSSDYGGCQMH